VAIAGCAVGPVPTTAQVTPRSVEVEGAELVLHAGDERRVLASFDEADGSPVHAALRPGDHDEDTVVVLTSVADDGGERYELRYLIATDDGVSALYGFPSRLQVAAELPAILDVAPVPVWSPEGDAIAWIEWVEQGTRLRTVGWIDDGETRNPSDESSAYALTGVPAGVQLEAWLTGVDGDPVLLASQDDQPYRIELALGDTPGGVIAGR
jgi:hypothetical protein